MSTILVAALAAKTVDAMVNVEPYNAIAVDQGIGTDLMDFSGVDPMPVFMATTRISSPRKPIPWSPTSRPGSTSPADFKNNPKKVANMMYSFYTSKGYTMSLDTFQTAMARVEVDPGFPTDQQYVVFCSPAAFRSVASIAICMPVTPPTPAKQLGHLMPDLTDALIFVDANILLSCYERTSAPPTLLRSFWPVSLLLLKVLCSRPAVHDEFRRNRVRSLH